jgi:hypothetical protein
MTGQEKGGFLIQMTTLAGLTVYENKLFLS